MFFVVFAFTLHENLLIELLEVTHFVDIYTSKREFIHGFSLFSLFSLSSKARLRSIPQR
jgi:hypothetical protein